MKIGLMGGIFDPIHLGHLNIASQAAHLFGLEKVYFITTAKPPHKKKSVSLARHRLAMTKMAVGGNPLFAASHAEMSETAPSYSIDTVERFRKKPKEVFFIMGMDTFEEIHTWKSADLLLQSCSFIVATRPGTDFKRVAHKLERKFRAKKTAFKISRAKGSGCGGVIRVSNSKHKIYICSFVELDISSTVIRKKIEKGEPVKYLVPDKVERYIIKERLYRRRNKK